METATTHTQQLSHFVTHDTKKREYMSNVKSPFIALGQFTIGCGGWLIISAVIILAILVPFGLDFETITPIVSFVVQLIGLGLTILAFRRNLRWIGIGIICALLLYLIGFVMHGGCMPAGLPFPLSWFPC